MNYAELMVKASLLRKRFGEDSDSPVDIFALAQNIDGLTIVFYPLGDNLSGMCVKGQEGHNVVAVNSAMSYGRQRFSLAHEFYHLYYDDNMVVVCAKKINSGKAVEKEADMFASYFLMPEPALMMMAQKLTCKHAAGRLTLNDVIRIEQYFGVSHQAAVYRLIYTPYLNEDEGKSFLDEPVRRKAAVLGFSANLYLPSPEAQQYMTYGNYIDQAEQVLANGLVSTGKYEQLLMDAFRADLVYGEEEESGEVSD